MSIKKKVVWLPYDMDTAIGINNEGSLVFGYELEDVDQIEGGADVFNGQQSVIWNNIREAFGDELAEMYKTLRSTGALSYAKVEQMFEEHQAKWPEKLVNEDERFKYIEPLTHPAPGKEATAVYLPMLQGLKTEQRKWWLYNRFRYIDSKYNAGDALVDVIQIRGYAKSNITIIPYADIYPAVKYGSYLVTERGVRGQATTLVCPLDNVNDTEIYIYSASQLASIGDLSGFKVGFADFSMATKIQSLKVGDSNSNYNNSNLNNLTLGSNVLLKTLDVRNCSALGTGDQKTVDISGCTNIEHVYFDGTAITGINLPNGGILKTLSLPATITNLTVLNQRNITNFSMGGTDYSNISTLRIENCSSAIPVLDILEDMAVNSRVRIIGFTMAVQSTTDVEDFFDYLDTMRGLDEQGNNLDHAVVAGTITGLGTITGEWLAQMNARYPNVNITYEHITSKLYYYNGETLYYTETITDGGNGTYSGTPTKSATAQYTYAFAGWSKDSDDNTVDADARTAVTADRNIYACYTATVRTYTVTWKNADGTTLETDNNVPYGSTPQYNGSTPTYDGQTSTGWNPTPSSVTGNVTYTATYLPIYTVTFKNDTGSTTLDTQRVVQGGTATYGGTTPTSSEDASLTWLGWATSANSHNANAVLTNIQSSMTVYAAFESVVEVAEITDSWDTIIANIDNGTYGTKYKIGNYKPLDLGTEGTINMQIVAMDKDIVVNGGTSTAPLTFVAIELLNTWRRINQHNKGTGKFYESELNTILNSTIYDLIPTNVKSRIQNVRKITTTTYQSGSTWKVNTYSSYITKIFIPSHCEVIASSESYTRNSRESTDITYKQIYYNDASRKKQKLTGDYGNWWLRSQVGTGLASDVHNYRYIGSSGLLGSNSESQDLGVCIGFCLGLEPETISDSWETILANTNYATDYKIGDTKMLDLGTEGKHLMEIVAFDTDDRADGQGKAGITWISKDLLKTQKEMNDTASTVGGWEQSGMRNYLKTTIKSLIPTAVRNGIVEVSKVSSTYENNTLVQDGQTTTDDVWIPSYREVAYRTNCEQTGANYWTRFGNNNDTRVKSQNGNTTGWWLRTASNSTSFKTIPYDGNPQSSYAPVSARSTRCIALGFCTN